MYAGLVVVFGIKSGFYLNNILKEHVPTHLELTPSEFN